jgi:hypothetical protein
MTRLLALSLALLPVAACAADNGDEGLYLSRILASGDACTFTADEGAPYLSSGSYSVGSPLPYEAHVLIQSRLTLREDQEAQARTVQMRGARVDLAFANPDDDPGIQDEYLHFTSLFSAPVTPGGLATAGFDLVPSQVSIALIEKLDAKPEPVPSIQLVATVEAYGDLAGDEVVTQSFVFPVAVTELRNNLGTCPLPAGTTVRTGNACNPFQDGIVDCCQASDGVVCPATVATTTQ